jgi:competence protein ComEC
MHIDYLLLSHPDRDHFGGLVFIARNFTPAEFWTGGTSSRGTTYAILLAAIRTAGARTRRCDGSSAAMIIGGVGVRCLGPIAGLPQVKDNNASMVVRLSYGHTTLLFPGDLEAKGERELVATGVPLDATILKVPHHGSRTSSSAPFIERVHPIVAVISLGYRNRFHFPASEVLGRYADQRVRVLRTDEVGAIAADVSRDRLHVWSFRGGDLPIAR